MAEEMDTAMQRPAWADALPRAGWKAYPRAASPDDWFEVHKLREGLWAIYEPGHFQEVISFLVEGSDKAMLIDSGLGIGDIKAVVEALTDKPVFVVNTHTHFDHVGGNHQFETVYIPDCPEAIARAAAGFSQEELAVNMVPGSNSQPWPAGFDPAGYTIQPFAATPAPEGTVFDLGGWKLTVVNTPGHSPDSIMLYDAEKKLLFTGDSFYPAALYVDLNSEKPVPELLAIYQKTMAELAKQFGDYTLICSHNEPFCDSSFLGKTAAALGEVLAGKAPDEVGSTGLKRYEYEGFAIITH